MRYIGRSNGGIMETPLSIRETELMRIDASQLRQRDRWLIQELRHYRAMCQVGGLVCDSVLCALVFSAAKLVFHFTDHWFIILMCALLFGCRQLFLGVSARLVLRCMYAYSHPKRRRVDRQLMSTCPHCERNQSLRSEKCAFCKAPLLPPTSAYR